MREFKRGDEVYLDFEEMERRSPNRGEPWSKWCQEERNAKFIDYHPDLESAYVMIGKRSIPVPEAGIKINKNKIVIDILKDL